MTRQILRAEFATGEVILTYYTVPNDLRATGLHRVHHLVIPLDDHEYDDEVEAAHDALVALLEDALEDLTNLPPHDPHQEQDDPDEDPDDD